MPRHQIKEIDVFTLLKVDLAGSYGNGSNKALSVHINPITKEMWFVVTDHRIEITKETELYNAVDIYNRLK